MKNKYLLLIFIFTFAISGCAYPKKKDRDCLFQVSTINALMEGVYDGYVTCSELKKYGDFGIGTFDALDGEMIVLYGKVYQVRFDGAVLEANDYCKTPLADVVFFSPDKNISLRKTKNMAELEKYIDDFLFSENIFYAIKIDGLFKYIKVRSVAAQIWPYPKLSEAVQGQKVFEFNDIKGTIVGFRSPLYAGSIIVPGYHLHFISADKMKGGHLLDCETGDCEIEIDEIRSFYLVLPHNKEFDKSNLSGDKNNELNKIEK